ncbi:MAG: cobalt-precorrin-6A reductase [Hyphomicrobiales bacterium]|nr:cobalt-precorrin-6A reductase [Hyphomicrobiales bacterium]
MAEGSNGTLLILGGTGEAVDLAAAAVARFGPALRVVTSRAGVTQDPAPVAGAERRGGFGGVDGLAAYLAAESVDLVVDATHPFAAAMSAQARAACLRAGVPRLQLLRPPWAPGPGDRWVEVADAAAAARALPGLARRVFLTTGRRGLESYAGCAGLWFLVRLIEAPDTPLPLPACQVVTGRPPFTLAAERDLLARHRIDGLVTKNSGGAAGAAKLAAAREAGLPVVLLARPAAEPGERAETVDQAMDWLARRV